MNRLQKQGQRLIVHLPVELDHHYTEELRKEIDMVVREEPVSELEFDFSRTMFMDSAGIGMILGRYRIMEALDGQVITSHMSGQIYRILKLSGIQRYIHLEKGETL